MSTEFKDKRIAQINGQGLPNIGRASALDEGLLIFPSNDVEHLHLVKTPEPGESNVQDAKSPSRIGLAIHVQLPRDERGAITRRGFQVLRQEPVAVQEAFILEEYLRISPDGTMSVDGLKAAGRSDVARLIKSDFEGGMTRLKTENGSLTRKPDGFYQVPENILATAKEILAAEGNFSYATLRRYSYFSQRVSHYPGGMYQLRLDLNLQPIRRRNGHWTEDKVVEAGVAKIEAGEDITISALPRGATKAVYRTFPGKMGELRERTKQAVLEKKRAKIATIDAIYTEKWQSLVSLARRYGSKDPENAVQNTYVQAVSKADSYRDRAGGSIEQWNTVLLHNKVMDELRSPQSRDVPLFDRTSHRSTSFEDTVLKRIAFEEELDRIDPRPAELIRQLGTDTYQEIAASSGSNVDAVRHRAERVRKKYKDQMVAVFR